MRDVPSRRRRSFVALAALAVAASAAMVAPARSQASDSAAVARTDSASVVRTDSTLRTAGAAVATADSLSGSSLAMTPANPMAPGSGTHGNVVVVPNVTGRELHPMR